MKIEKNQYILIPCGIENKFQYSNVLKFCDYNVLLGEKCHATIMKNSRFNILLLGYAVDAQNPKDIENILLTRLIKYLAPDVSNISDLTLYWGGRWVLFVCYDNNLIAMTDCCGLKQLYYGSNVFASQSRYVAYATNSEIDNEAYNYINQAKVLNKEYSWPLDSTLYKSVKKLLPNHKYVCGNVQRIYISNHLINVKPDDWACEVSSLLENLLHAVSLRFKLAVTLTAGFDSRLVFSACNNIKSEIDVVTLKYHHVQDNDNDIIIPKKLCQKYGYKHKVLLCNPLKNDFIKAYKTHSENAHDYWIQMSQCVQDYGYNDWLWVKGSCNEVGRNSFGVLYNWQVNSRVLCKLYGIFKCKYSHNVINQWLKDANSYSQETGYSVLDIFYWEHRLGSWLAECINESDIVGETFSPFNVRAYFEIIKSVPVLQRIPPNYSFFMNLIKENGISFDIPVNPHRYDSFVARTKCYIKNKMPILYGIMLNL